MVKKYCDFTFELTVDGNPCPADAASPLFQSDPFPGGHRYSCVISGAKLRRYFDYLSLGYRESLSLDEASRFFTSLGLQWDDEECAPRYLLNSVDELDFDGYRLNFSGICSPVVAVNRDA